MQKQLDRERQLRLEILTIQESQARQEVKRDQVLKGIQAGIDADEQLDKVTDLEKAVESASLRMGRALEDALVSTIEAAVTGAEDLGETLQKIAADLLGDVGRMFIKAGISSVWVEPSTSLASLMVVDPRSTPSRSSARKVPSCSCPTPLERSSATNRAGQQWRVTARRTRQQMQQSATTQEAMAGGSGAGGDHRPTSAWNTTVIATIEYATVEQVRAMAMLPPPPSLAQNKAKQWHSAACGCHLQPAANWACDGTH